MARTGRPTVYSETIADKIITRLTNGESLSAICREEDKPDPATIYRWLAARPDFCDRYTRAKEEQADTLADEIIAIADEEEGDVQRARLRVDARKWVASKLKPKKYGERQEIEHTGNIIIDAPPMAKG